MVISLRKIRKTPFFSGRSMIAPTIIIKGLLHVCNSPEFLLFLRPEVHQVQADLGVGLAVDLAGEGLDDNFCGGADHGAVQVAAVAPSCQIAHGHVQVGVGALVLGGDGAGQGHDLKIRVEHVGLVLLGVGAEDPQGHIIHSTQAGDRCQTDVLHRSQPQHLFHNFIAGIQPDHISGAKFPIIHGNFSFFLVCHIL